MYGMLLESIQHFVSTKYGEAVWIKILEHAGLKNMVFTTHRIYTNETMLQLARSCCHVTKTKTNEEWMCFFGKCFVKFCSHYGYDNLLRVAGRHYSDFLHGIDNIHEMIRFSYPHLQSPSFMVLSEDTEGCVLLYQSKRQGFKQYVIGQLRQCAKRFYNVQVKIAIIEETCEESLCAVKFRLDFDNIVFKERTRARKSSGKCPFSRISCDAFLTVAPFCIIFDNHLQIKKVGKSMTGLLKGELLVGEHLQHKFRLRRPLIPFVWEKILAFQRVMFELEYYPNNSTHNSYSINRTHSPSDLEHGNSGSHKVHHITDEPVLLRGQMKYMDEWNMVAFLCTPLLGNLEGLRTAGLYINDLNMYDNSRDMVMAGWQHVSTLECSIEQQKGKSDQIAENLQMTEQWKEKSNSLLYSMIPKAIAERLKDDEDPIKTCEVFDNVTIMFNYMVGFSEICASASPLKIVECINSVFVMFDNIVDKYNVFKVETLGDAVYMIAGGVPDRSPQHAENVAALALEFQETATGKRNFMLKDRVTTRIGMHTGSVVGGVVGRRMPQYCLFGDTVNTASRMQTYSMPGRIHISEPCNECLRGTDFVTVFRGTVNVKGKGEMRTYWLAGRAGEDRTRRFCDDVKHDNSKILEKKANQHSSYDLHGMLASNSYGQFMDFKKRDSLQDTGQLGKSMSQSEDAGSQDDSSESSGFASDTKQHAIDKDNTIPVSFEIGSNRSSIKGSDPSFDIDSPRLVLKGSDVFEVGSPKTSQMRDVLLDIDGPNKPHVCDVSFEIGSPKRSKATDAALKDDSPKTDLIEPPLELHRTLNDISDSFLDISISKAGNAVQDISDIDTGEPVETEASEVYEIESPQLTSPISIDMSEDELGQFPDETIDRVFVNDDEQICSCLNQGDIKFEFPKTTWELHKGIRHIEIDNKEYEDALMEPPHLPHVLGNLCPLPHTHYSRMPPIEELAQSATAEIQSQKEEPKVGKEDINHHNQYSTGGKHSLVPATETDMYNEDSTRLDSNTDKIHNSDSSTMCPCGNPNEAENDGGTDFSQSQPCQCINDDRTRETRRRSNNTTQHSTADEVLSSLTNGDIFNNTSEINRNYTAVAKPCLTRVPNECVNGHNQGLDCCPHMENLGLDMSRKMRDWQGKGLQFRLSLTDDIDDD